MARFFTHGRLKCFILCCTNFGSLGEKYLKKERDRNKKYRVPVSELTEREKLKRREKIRNYVRKHREKKKVKENFIKAAASTMNGVDVSNIMLIEECRSEPPPEQLYPSIPSQVIKFNFEKGKQTRKRSARSAANPHRIASS